MDFIANFWWLWLALMVVSTVFVLVNQLARMNRMRKSISRPGRLGDFDSSVKEMSKGMTSAIIAGFVSWGSGILLLLAIAIQLVRYFAQQ